MIERMPRKMDAFSGRNVYKYLKDQGDDDQINALFQKMHEVTTAKFSTKSSSFLKKKMYTALSEYLYCEQELQNRGLLKDISQKS